MKAVGFFFAVFISMLTVFLVATGEVTRWFGSSQAIPPVLIPEAPAGVSSQNMLDFEFWDVKEGRRRFIIRAELSQDALQGSDPLNDLKEITLKDGIIQLPLVKEGGSDAAPQELVVHFKRAIYSKHDGIASGKQPLRVMLHEGRGKMTEGTEFFFEELLFTQSEEDKGRFEISTDKPVRIVKSPHLEVHSSNGLNGLLSDQGGFERLNFLPPVSTYLTLDVLNVLSAEPAKTTPEPTHGKASARKVAAICQGPLQIQFREKALQPGVNAGEHRLRVTFKQDVVLFSIDEVPALGAKPVPVGNRFECQKLQLELDTAGSMPVPSYALATWEGDRVKGYFMKGPDAYTLDGDQLEWFNLGTSVETSLGEDLLPDKFESKAVISGKPRLRGKDLDLVAERAEIDPNGNVVILETVQGRFRHAKSGRKRSAAAGSTEPKPSAASKAESDDAWSWDHAATGMKTGPKSGKSFEILDFIAPEMKLYFSRDDDEHQQALSHFVASSPEPRGVIIEGHDQVEDDGEPGFRAEGHLLTYAKRDDERQLTLEGDGSVRPRLSFGASWIEARKTHLFLDRQFAYFENDVHADFDRSSSLAFQKKTEKGPELAKLPRRMEIDAAFLEVQREGSKLSSAVARGTETEPVVLTVTPDMDGAEKSRPFRFLSPEMQLDAQNQVVQLFGVPAAKQKPARWATMEFSGGKVLAGRMRFEMKTYKCFLRDKVDVRLFSSKGDRSNNRRVLADKADIEFFEGFRGEDETKPGVGGMKPGAGGMMSQLSMIKSLHAMAGKEDRISIVGKGFVLHGEEATWDSEKEELRFFGPGVQEILLDHEDVKGPITAREIVYNRKTQVVTLRGSVRGELSQAPKTISSASLPAGAGQPLVWEFETNALDLQLRQGAEQGSVELAELRAREKVLLRNREKGLKFLGDDLIYDHDKRTVRIFSEEGRLQTLMRERSLPSAKGASGKPDVLADEILARELTIFLYEDPLSYRESRRPKQTVVVQFEKEVKATLNVDGSSTSGRRAPRDQWKLESNTLTLHINPEADAKSPHILTRAIATGDVVASSTFFRAVGHRAEYVESERRLTFEGSPASVTDFRLKETTTVPAGVPVTIRKVGDLVTIEDPRIKRKKRK